MFMYLNINIFKMYLYLTKKTPQTFPTHIFEMYLCIM